MKALTLWQPWATLIVKNDKHIETRGHKTNILGRVAIHAAKADHCGLLLHMPMSKLKFFQESKVCGFPEPPRGCIVGTVEIIGCMPIEELYGSELDTPKERAFGDWSKGRYGWILRNPVIFDKPIPAKGSQGFWNWQADEKTRGEA